MAKQRQNFFWKDNQRSKLSIKILNLVNERKKKEDEVKNKSTKKEEYDNIDNWRGYDEIDCLALAQHNLKVSVRGTITPCCYLSSGVETTAVYKSEKYPYQHLTTTGQQKDGPHPVMQNMLDRIGDFQLGKGKSIFELLSDPWWEKYLPESWEDRDTPIFGCAKICGKKSCMATTELEIHASLQE